MDRNQYLGVLLATLVGATLGGVVYHALTCKACKGEAGVDEVAQASANMKGPRVVP